MSSMRIAPKLAILGLCGALVAGCAANPGGSGQLGDACGDLGWGKIGGTLAGAAGGAYVGSRWSGAGRGTQTAATAAGALLGGLAGFLAGRSIDRGQCESAYAARNQALNNAQLGQSINWSQGNASGSFTPTRTGTDTTGAECREYEQTIRVDGVLETGVGRACRRPDGRWQIVNN